MMIELVSGLSLANHSNSRVLPGGARLVQPRWMLERRILAGGRTCGVFFWPFPNSSGWWRLISSVLLTRTSCCKTTYANSYYGAWPGWKVSISVRPLTVWSPCSPRDSQESSATPLKEIGISDHLTCLLRNLYAGQEATVRTGHGTTDWFQIRCILPPYLFNLYVEYVMWNARLDEAQAGIKIARRNNTNLRYADDTTLMAESEEEPKSFLMKVKEESEKVGLKLNIQKMKIMASGPVTSWQIDGETMETVRDYFLGLQNHCRWWLQQWN